MRDSYELRVWWPMNASHTSSQSKAKLLLEQSSRLAAKTTDSLIAFKPCRDNSKHSVSITFSDWLLSGKETEIISSMKPRRPGFWDQSTTKPKQRAVTSLLRKLLSGASIVHAEQLTFPQQCPLRLSWLSTIDSDMRPTNHMFWPDFFSLQGRT